MGKRLHDPVGRVLATRRGVWRKSLNRRWVTSTHPTHGRDPGGEPRGFTLFEVLLALALSAVVLAVLAAAIQVTLRATDSGRTDVEQAQLARALLRRIADDLRAAIPAASTAAADATSAGLSGGASSGDGSGTGSGTGGGSGSGDAGGGGGSGASGASSGSGSGSSSSGGSDSSSSSNSASTASMPGVYGGVDWIEVDLSRLPRSEEYAALAQQGAGAAFHLISDVKTVSYYLTGSTYGAGRAVTDGPAAQPLAAGVGGLVRGEDDRLALLYALAAGGNVAESPPDELLAPGVTGLAFRYYDGYAWSDTWDTDEFGGLPMAIEIALEISPPVVAAPRRLGSFFTSADDARTRPPAVYRHLVHLPIAVPLEDAPSPSNSDTGEDSSSSSSGSSSTTGSSSGGGSSGGSTSGGGGGQR